MCKKGAILDQARCPRKPCELSDAEVLQLMQAFTRGKREVLEEDALTVCRWAQAQKFGAYVLELVLAGHLVPSVKEGQVCVALPGRPHA